MSSHKKNMKKEKKQEINEEEVEFENEEENEENEEIDNEEGEPEENEEEENENEKEEKQNDDLDERIANIGDASLKIQNIVSILSDFKTKREEGKSRSTYMSELKELCKSYYEYNDDICDLIFNLFPPNEAIEFMEASDSQKVLTIRTNSLKTKRRELAKNLITRGVNLDPLAEWSKVGLKIYSSSVPIGATPEYLSGQYMLQSASSFLPVLALDPHPGDKILDMCASPGGKTTYIGQLMKNEGLLVANDFKKERIKSLFFNIHRMGIKNSIVTNYDGREFAKLFNRFDRVLLDAPCSGLGVISKDKSVKMNRTYKEILNNSRLQKELILAAIDSCNAKGKGDGIIVYSTCSISVEENEWVIDYALKHRYVKCIECGIEIGEPGLVKFREKHFHPSIVNTRRIYPHIHNIDGFFIAKLKKYSDGVKIKGDAEKAENKNKSQNKKSDSKNEENNDAEPEVDVEDYENNLEENSEPEDIQEQIKKGKLRNYNLGDDKGKKSKKKNKKEEDEEDDGIFSGEEYEKVEEDVEKEANKKSLKQRRKEQNKNKEKQEDISKQNIKDKKEIKDEWKKQKEKSSKKDKKEVKEKNNNDSDDEKETQKEKKSKKNKGENEGKMKRDKSNKNLKMKKEEIELEEEEEENDKLKSSQKKQNKEKKDSKKLSKEKKDDSMSSEEEENKKTVKKVKNKNKEKEGKKELEEKEEKLISKKRKESENKENKSKDKSNKKKKK